MKKDEALQSIVKHGGLLASLHDELIKDGWTPSEIEEVKQEGLEIVQAKQREETELTIDPDRDLKGEEGEYITGIYVRAKNGDKWGTYDIGELDSESLLLWLRSRGGMNPWAENVIGMLLGHGQIAEEVPAPAQLKDPKMLSADDE